MSKARPRCTDWKMWNKKKNISPKGVVYRLAAAIVYFFLSGRAYVGEVRLTDRICSAVRLRCSGPNRECRVTTAPHRRRPPPPCGPTDSARKMSRGRSAVSRPSSDWAAYQPFCLPVDDSSSGRQAQRERHLANPTRAPTRSWCTTPEAQSSTSGLHNF